MGITHIRTPKNFVLEERLERYEAAIECHPEHNAGRWAHACAPLGNGLPQRFSAVHLDLGCGKGAYLIARARREPDHLFIGMDTEPICIAYAAQYIVEAGLANALVLPRGAQTLEKLFRPGELNGITLNFPTPYPKRKFATRRLVYVDYLLAYRELLAPGATVTLRTDSQPLRDYALTQFDAAGYRAQWVSDNVRAEHPEHPETEYEHRLAAQGAQVYGVCATPSVQVSEQHIEQGRTVEQSLVKYLPRDLDSLTYVPLGMEGAVINMRNRRRNQAARAPRA